MCNLAYTYVLSIAQLHSKYCISLGDSGDIYLPANDPIRYVQIYVSVGTAFLYL